MKAGSITKFVLFIIVCAGGWIEFLSIEIPILGKIFKNALKKKSQVKSLGINSITWRNNLQIITWTDAHLDLWTRLLVNIMQGVLFDL